MQRQICNGRLFFVLLPLTPRWRFLIFQRRGTVFSTRRKIQGARACILNTLVGSIPFARALSLA